MAVESGDGEVHVYPRDSVKKRVRWITNNIDVEVQQGEITEAAWNKSSPRVRLSDSTGFVKTVQFAIEDLPHAESEIAYGEQVRKAPVLDRLDLKLPIAAAGRNQKHATRTYCLAAGPAI